MEVFDLFPIGPISFSFLALLCIPGELTPVGWVFQVPGSVGFRWLRPMGGTVQTAGGRKAGQVRTFPPPVSP